MALDPTAFGRRNPLQAELAQRNRSGADDLRLFAATFVAGFVFVSIFLG
jgi:hypothetical protein